MKIKTLLWLFMLLSLPGLAIAGQAVLSWDGPVSNVDGTPLTDLGGFKVYYGLSSGSYTTVIDVGMATLAQGPCQSISDTSCQVHTYTVSNLSAGTTYYFAATAYDTTANESGYSNEVSKIILSASIPAPTALQAVGNGGTITLSWDRNNYSNIAGYQISKGQSSGLYNGSYEVGTAQASSAPCVISYTGCVRRQFALYNIKPGTYYFAVKGYDSAGNFSAYSNEVSVTLTADTTLPNDVTNFTATKLNDTSIRLSWTNPSNPDFSGLILEYAFGAQTTYVQIATLKGLPSAPQTYDHKNLAPGNYNYRIHTVDTSGNVTSTRYASLALDGASSPPLPPTEGTSPTVKPPAQSGGSGGGFGCACGTICPPNDKSGGGKIDMSALMLAAIPIFLSLRRKIRTAKTNS